MAWRGLGGISRFREKCVAGWERERRGGRGIDNRGDSDSDGTINLVLLRGFGGS